METIQFVKIQMIREKEVEVHSKKISSPKDAAKICKQVLENEDRENLIVLALDTKNNVNAINVVSIGSLNSSIVHPREVFKPLILANACSFIISHNHPSGNTTPSSEDINITKRLKECSKFMGIDLLDHIIIGNNEYISLKEEGLI